MTSVQTLTILGATGSIGRSTLDVVARHPERYRIYALTAFTRVNELGELCRQHNPVYAVVADEARATVLRELLQDSEVITQVLVGEVALARVAEEADTVMAAIVGAAGLLPTLAAVKAGRRVLLANKEALVMSGALFMRAVREHGATLLPIDSEHNAIFQCLPHNAAQGLSAVGVEKLLLTASGGPFREFSIEQLKTVTPAQAVKHPNWSMGQKISVDSATLMNKGLEFIEACWLFGAEPNQIDVVVHPQSVIHSMVCYADGSVLAQMGQPDMRTPIAHALAWPERIASGVPSLNFAQLASLSFEAPDESRFPCLRLAKQAMLSGGTHPAILNAANEVAVAAFLAGQLDFLGIARVIEQVLNEIPVSAAEELATILAADTEARERAHAIVAQYLSISGEG